MEYVARTSNQGDFQEEIRFKLRLEGCVAITQQMSRGGKGTPGRMKVFTERCCGIRRECEGGRGRGVRLGVALAPCLALWTKTGLHLRESKTSLTFCTEQLLSGKVSVLGSFQSLSFRPPSSPPAPGPSGGRPHPLVTAEAGCGAERSHKDSLPQWPQPECPLYRPRGPSSGSILFDLDGVPDREDRQGVGALSPEPQALRNGSNQYCSLRSQDSSDWGQRGPQPLTWSPGPQAAPSPGLTQGSRVEGRLDFCPDH